VLGQCHSCAIISLQSKICDWVRLDKISKRRRLGVFQNDVKSHRHSLILLMGEQYIKKKTPCSLISLEIV